MRPFLGDHPPFLAHINLVPQYHEWKVIGVSWRGLDQELISPGIERLEGLGAVDIIDKYTAICASVEGDAKGLETLLTGCVPKLKGNDTIVDCDFLSQEVRAYRCFVGGAELLIDL